MVGASNDEIRIGDRVELDWIERAGVPVPVFRLAEDAPDDRLAQPDEGQGRHRRRRDDRLRAAEHRSQPGVARGSRRASPCCVSAGLSAGDVDGICGTLPGADSMQAALGIPEVTWFANPMIPFVNHVAAAVAAVHTGLCDVVLAYHAAYRLPWNTVSSLKDPFRRRGAGGACRRRPRDHRWRRRLHRMGVALHPRVRGHQ